MAGTKRKTEQEQYRSALQMISPGAPIREAISFILQSGTGALLCFGQPKRMTDLSEGGVRLDAPCTPPRQGLAGADEVSPAEAIFEGRPKIAR